MRKISFFAYGILVIILSGLLTGLYVLFSLPIVAVFIIDDAFVLRDFLMALGSAYGISFLISGALLLPIFLLFNGAYSQVTSRKKRK